MASLTSIPQSNLKMLRTLLRIWHSAGYLVLTAIGRKRKSGREYVGKVESIDKISNLSQGANTALPIYVLKRSGGN